MLCEGIKVLDKNHFRSDGGKPNPRRVLAQDIDDFAAKVTSWIPEP